MSTLTVQILLHGLIVLTPVKDPDGAVGANHMQAFLVDATRLPTGVQAECFDPVMHAHKPVLKVSTNPSYCNAIERCTPDGFTCTCDLTRRDLSLVIDPPYEPARQQLSTEPASGLPFDFTTADDFGYVANLARVVPGMTIKTAVRDDANPPDSLIARMDFPFSSVTACGLAVRRTEGNNNVHSLSFRLLHKLEHSGEVNQALAQSIISRLAIPYSGTPAPQVRIAIREFDASSPQELPLRPAGGRVEIEVTNSVPEEHEMAIDDPCDDGIARHFAFLYEILDNAPPWDQRPIPHIKYTQWKSANDLEAIECDPTKDPTSRPICPMGSINP